MFKKSNRNFRTKKAETSSSDGESSQNSKEETTSSCIPSRSAAAVTTKLKISFETTNKVLSFSNDIHEDENCEEFKVKKSKESRRIAKELKKSKKEKLKQLNSNEPSIIVEEDEKTTQKKPKSDPQLTSEDVLFNEGIRVKPLNIKLDQTKSKKQARFLINKYGTQSDEEFERVEQSDEEEDEATKLERLRREMESLNGEESEQLEDEQDDRKRNMKLMLKVGIIPDAAMIHEFRKKREMARQGDYIPINNHNSGDKSKSRLVREDDDNDLSEDEDGINDSNRMSMNYKNKMHMERQIQRDNFLAYENGSDDDESNKEDEEEDEEERWEREQIRKGVQISQKTKLDFDNHKTTKKQIQAYLLNANIEQEPMELDDTKTYDLEKLNSLPDISFMSIKSQLKNNISLLNETKQKNLNEHKMRLENLSANKLDLEIMKKMKPNLDKQYVYYQEMKSYLQDYIECYNEKLAQIENASASYISLLRQRADRIVQRRQQDYKDQSVENAVNKKSTIDPIHEQRISEREKRRANKKQKSSSSHKDGLSSDDEEDTDLTSEKYKLVTDLNQLVLNDINEEFYRFDLIKQRFEKWKQLSLDTYRTAYASYSLPKLFSPLIKFHLVTWNPLEDYNPIENTNWYKDLITYDRENMLKCLTNNDKVNLDDYLLVPHIIEKTLLERLIDFCDVYDPMSTRQTNNLTNLISKLISDYPTLNSKSENTKKMFDLLVNRIRKCLDNDVFIPLYPKHLIEQQTCSQNKFFYRQFWQCAKLYSNLLKWKSIFNTKLVKELTLDCMLNRYLMIGLQSMEFNSDLIETIEFLVSKLPSEWLVNEIPQLVNLVRFLKRFSDSTKDENILKRLTILLTQLASSDI